jgi:hypothetical protein
MANPVRIGDTEKQLDDCLLEDVEMLAQGAAPATPNSRRPITQQTNFALLAEEMRKEGAAYVSDLGAQRVVAWEQNLGLHYASKEAVFRALSRQPRQ